MKQMIDTDVPVLYRARLSLTPCGLQCAGQELVFRIDGKIFVDLDVVRQVMADGSLGEQDTSVKRDAIVEFVDICDRALSPSEWDFGRRSKFDSKVGKPLPKWANCIL